MQPDSNNSNEDKNWYFTIILLYICPRYSDLGEVSGSIAQKHVFYCVTGKTETRDTCDEIGDS